MTYLNYFKNIANYEMDYRCYTDSLYRISNIAMNVITNFKLSKVGSKGKSM